MSIRSEIIETMDWVIKNCRNPNFPSEHTITIAQLKDQATSSIISAFKGVIPKERKTEWYPEYNNEMPDKRRAIIQGFNQAIDQIHAKLEEG